MNAFTVKVPATTSNMGPGFDCIGMALSLYNEADFCVSGEGLRVSAEGFTNQEESDPKQNMIYRMFAECCVRHGVQPPANLSITCRNHVPMGSGMGSSATAVLLGILAADAWGEFHMSQSELLKLASEMEHHPDNAAPALYGGLVSAVLEDGEYYIQRYQPADWNLAVVYPHFVLSTENARKALPKEVPLQDAVYNIGHMMMVTKALESGDEKLLGLGMRDKLHERFRMALLPGSKEACVAARQAGAAAAGISGAGPSVIAYSMGDVSDILAGMEAVYRERGLSYTSFLLKASPRGASVEAL